jgi:hypothetical protein
MLQSNYQRVGALAGLLMFFGAWLSAYYNHWGWAFATVVAVLAAIWMALENEPSEDLGQRAIKGFVTGALAAVVARVLGMLTMVWAFDSWSSSVTKEYDSISDLFRVLLNGDFVSSLLAILGVGLVGAFIAYSMPYFTADREEE